MANMFLRKFPPAGQLVGFPGKIRYEEDERFFDEEITNILQ